MTKDKTFLINKTKIGLILSAGGAKGLAHIGVLKVLEKNGIKISSISGSSIGSIIGAYSALGYSALEIESIALSYDKKKIKKIFDLDIPLKSLLKGKKTRQYLLEMYKEKTFSDLKIPFYPIATNLATGKPYVFKSGKIVDAVEASISLPAIYKPKKIGDVEFTDGGVVEPFPISVLKKKVNFTIGIRLPYNYEKLFIVSKIKILQIMARSLSIMEENLTSSTIDKYKPDFVFDLRKPLETFSDFDFKKANEIIGIGETEAKKHIRKLIKKINNSGL